MIAELREKFRLPFVVQVNEHTSVAAFEQPARLLRSPVVQAARAAAQAQSLRGVRSGSADESLGLNPLQELAGFGIFFAVLLSDRESAAVYFSSSHRQPMAHNELRADLINHDLYHEDFPATSGMLVSLGADRWTLVTDEARMIWPERLTQTRVGYIPALSADIIDISSSHKKVCGSAFIGTEEGHILFAADERSMRTNQQAQYNSWVRGSFSK